MADDTQIPLAGLADYLENELPNCTMALRWAGDCPDRFTAVLISLGPQHCARVLTLAAAALAIAGDNPRAEPADIMRTAADTQDYNWSELRELLTHRFIDAHDA